jgi:hypothetical protein
MDSPKIARSRFVLDSASGLKIDDSGATGEAYFFGSAPSNEQKSKPRTMMMTPQYKPKGPGISLSLRRALGLPSKKGPREAPDHRVATNLAEEVEGASLSPADVLELKIRRCLGKKSRYYLKGKTPRQKPPAVKCSGEYLDDLMENLRTIDADRYASIKREIIAQRTQSRLNSKKPGGTAGDHSVQRGKSRRRA